MFVRKEIHSKNKRHHKISIFPKTENLFYCRLNKVIISKLALNFKNIQRDIKYKFCNLKNNEFSF